MWSCDLEKLFIPLEAHHKAQWSENFLFSGKKLPAVIFSLLANPAEPVYLSVRDGELSNAVRLVEFRRRKSAVSTTLEGRRVSSEVRLETARRFGGGPNLDRAVHNTVTMDAHRAMSFFALLTALILWLTSYPGEIAYFNSPNQELSSGVRVMALY